MPLNQKNVAGLLSASQRAQRCGTHGESDFRLHRQKEEAGPNNNWMAPAESYDKLGEIFMPAPCAAARCMSFRSSWGPRVRLSAKSAFEITDSVYVVLNMRIMTRMGKIALDHLGDCRRLHPLSALQATSITGAPLHLSLPARQHDLERRLGLRRQRAAGQEVPGAAHRQLARPEGRLARRAHAHPRRRKPRGRDDLRRRGVPERLRQDQLRHADPAATHAGLEDRDRRRRHRLDARRAGRPALGDQSRKPAIFGVAPGTSSQDQPERDET